MPDPRTPASSSRPSPGPHRACGGSSSATWRSSTPVRVEGGGCARPSTTSPALPARHRPATRRRTWWWWVAGSPACGPRGGCWSAIRRSGSRSSSGTSSAAARAGATAASSPAGGTRCRALVGSFGREGGLAAAMAADGAPARIGEWARDHDVDPWFVPRRHARVVSSSPAQDDAGEGLPRARGVARRRRPVPRPVCGRGPGGLRLTRVPRRDARPRLMPRSTRPGSPAGCVASSSGAG